MRWTAGKSAKRRGFETLYSVAGAVVASIDCFSIFAFSADTRPRGVDGP